jgi:hypothetical protein
MNHVLPGEPGGDCTWFERQNAFEQREIRRQVAFRRRHWPDLPNGPWSNRPGYLYPHILPAGNERLAFYPPLADAILSYLEHEGIALHSEELNLKSSQVACLNVLFPLRTDLALTTTVYSNSIPAVALVGILIGRTVLEDRTLRRELPGYAEVCRSRALSPAARDLVRQ